ENLRKVIPYPADYICEAIDQTRGWFYTLLAVSSLLGLPAAYKRVVSLGLVLDEKGEKMSKSRGNVVDPNVLFEKYGADAVRWYFFTVNQPWDDKLFREENVRGALRGFLLILWNSFAYWKTYSGSMKHEARNTKKENASGFKFQVTSPKLVINKWILAKWQEALGEVTEHLEHYRMVEAARVLGEFTAEDLSRWYIRRIRSEMKQKKSAAAKECAHTLGFVLSDLARALAPFTPFVAEGIYQGLGGKKPSVHMEDWPKERKLNVESRELLEKMEKIRTIVSEALEARQKAGIKIRQPLSRLLINVGPSMFDKQLIDLICGEVNVKKVEFSGNLETSVALDTALTPELKEEGFVREFIRQVQDFRKELKLSPQDRVLLSAEGNSEDEKTLKRYEALIKKEITVSAFEIRAKKLNAKKEAVIDGKKIGIGIR
ncbi:MAG: class I tRNA ligase family protein, partial [Patescibacteria group bacterium]